jgi:hypothetical protein
MASFNTNTFPEYSKSINERNVKSAQTGSDSLTQQRNIWNAYLWHGTNDPRSSWPEYNQPLSRFGEWWKGYEKAYDNIYTGTENYRDDWNTVFDDTEQYLDTTPIQDEWRDYRDRIEGYYGNARGAESDLYAGYDQDFIDRPAYELWGDLATGDNQSQRVQDWFNQSTMGQYLEDQANENFWRQAQLGGQTYNPQEVQEFISNRIVAPEAQTAFGNLANYAQLQPELSWRVTSGMKDLERWYTEAVAQGDTYAQANISDLMNQMQQQLWQSNMTQGMGDAQMRYLLEAQMPATRTMDYTQQKLAHKDMGMLLNMAGANREGIFDFLKNTAYPNAYDSHMWESNMYQQALQNQESALNAQMATSLAGSALGAIGGMI